MIRKIQQSPSETVMTVKNAESSNILENRFFARHETFCPRYGWLKKGYDRVSGYNGCQGDDRIFDSPDAIERLGVGKNQNTNPPVEFGNILMKSVQQ